MLPRDGGGAGSSGPTRAGGGTACRGDSETASRSLISTSCPIAPCRSGFCSFGAGTEAGWLSPRIAAGADASIAGGNLPPSDCGLPGGTGIRFDIGAARGPAGGSNVSKGLRDDTGCVASVSAIRRNWLTTAPIPIIMRPLTVAVVPAMISVVPKLNSRTGMPYPIIPTPAATAIAPTKNKKIGIRLQPLIAPLTRPASGKCPVKPSKSGEFWPFAAAAATVINVRAPIYAPRNLPPRRCPGPRQSLINSIEELARDIPVSFLGPAFFPITVCRSGG